MLILISDAFDKSLPDKLKVFGEVTEDTSRLGEADVVLVRSKTKCTKEYIDSAKNLKLIIRGGVGMDNIDREYCKEKGIIAVNTPKSSSEKQCHCCSRACIRPHDQRSQQDRLFRYDDEERGVEQEDEEDRALRQEACTLWNG